MLSSLSFSEFALVNSHKTVFCVRFPSWTGFASDGSRDANVLSDWHSYRWQETSDFRQHKRSCSSRVASRIVQDRLLPDAPPVAVRPWDSVLGPRQKKHSPWSRSGATHCPLAELVKILCVEIPLFGPHPIQSNSEDVFIFDAHWTQRSLARKFSAFLNYGIPCVTVVCFLLWRADPYCSCSSSFY